MAVVDKPHYCTSDSECECCICSPFGYRNYGRVCEYDSRYVDCALCGKPTQMKGTKRCDPCWELEWRVKVRPDIARRILNTLGGADETL